MCLGILKRNTRNLGISYMSWPNEEESFIYIDEDFISLNFSLIYYCNKKNRKQKGNRKIPDIWDVRPII